MKHQEIIQKMKLEEKASLLSGKNFWETMDYPEYGIPSCFLSDGPHGLRKQAAAADQLGLNPSLPATCFPTAASLANSWNVDLAKSVGTALGEEAVKLKVHMVLGPGMNMKRNPRCGRNFEYFAEDPYLAGKLAANMVKGIQSNGVGACIKHYACNSQETRRINSDSVVDERALREIYTTAFEIAVKEGETMAVMSSYNMVNGYYVNENNHLEKDILRNEFGYKGLIVTDWGGENDRVKGLIATNELEMPGNNGDTDREVIKAVKSGLLDEKVVDESVDNIIDFALKTNKVFLDYKEPVGEINGVKVTGINCFPEMKEAHHQVAKNASDETMILLKNDNHLLPLRLQDKVAVIGDFASAPRYQGAGSSQVNATRLDNFTDLKDKYKFEYVGYAQGFDRYNKKKNKTKLEEAALSIAKKADIVVYFMGLDEVTESEGLDRDDILIPSNQIELLDKLHALGKKIVVILSTGSVVDMSWDKNCDALINGALSGQAGCNSILDFLNGDVTPSGKTSETYLMKYEDTPSIDNFATGKIQVIYGESIYIGYRYFEKNDIEVKYPFGFGLSYTTFEYSSLVVTDKGIKVTIKNTGDYKGKEIVQLYVGLKDSKIFRPVKELKGFVKTKLLNPGEEETVEIPFDDKTFRYFNVKTKRWEIEEGEYDLYVASSSKDIRLAGKIKQEGTSTVIPYEPSLLPSYYSGKVQHVSLTEFKLLYGEELPVDEFDWCNKKHTRMYVRQENLFCDLVYARGWRGRLIGKVLRHLIKQGKKYNRSFRNMIEMGPNGVPIRAISRMMGLPMMQCEGLRMMLNGQLIKGFRLFRKGRKEKPKYKKENHYQKAKKKN